MWGDGEEAGLSHEGNPAESFEKKTRFLLCVNNVNAGGSITIE
jgi:hypothetical protein